LSLELVLLCIYVALFFVVHKEFDLRSIHNPFVVFLFFSFLFLFVGGLYSNIYDGTPYEIFDDNANIIMVVVVGGMLSSFLAMLIISRLVGYRHYKISQMRIAPERSGYFFVSGFLVSLLGVFLGILYMSKVGVHFGEDADFYRVENKRGNGKLVIAAINFMQVGAMLMLCNASGVLRKAVTIVIFFVVAISLFFFGNRLPLLLFLISYFLVSSMLSGKEVPLRNYILIAVSAFVIFVLIGTLRKGLDDILEVSLLRLPWRPYVNFYNLDYILSYYSSNYLLGYGYIHDLLAATPLLDENFGQWLKGLLRMRFDGGSVTYTYLGEGYVNFGRLGFYVYGFIYPFIMYLVYLFFFNKSSVSSTEAGMYVLMSMSLNPSVSSGLLPCVLYNVFPQVLIIVVLVGGKRLVPLLRRS